MQVNILEAKTKLSKRIGVAKGKLKSPDDLDRYNEEVAQLFGGRSYETATEQTCIRAEGRISM